MKEFGIGLIVVAFAFALGTGVVGLTIMGWQSVRVYSAEYTVKTEKLVGEAEFVRAEQNRRILVEQARAEKDAAVLRAEAIEIVGQAAKDFPEYRVQEFLGAFGEALQSDSVDKLIFVPTEANIPITEAGRSVE